MTRTRTLLLALLGVLVLVLSACAGSDSTDEAASTGNGAAETTDDESVGDDDVVAEGEMTSVVVTTSVLGDIANQVLDGTSAEVEVLMPPGADPHSFQASASDGVTMRETDLVIANGLQLEEALLDVLEAAEEDGATVIEVAEQVDPIENDGDHGHDHGEDGHDHSDEEGHDHSDEEDHDHGDEDGHDHGDEEEHSDEEASGTVEIAAVDEDEHGDEDGHDDGDHGDEDHGDEDHDHGDEDKHSDEEGHDHGDDGHEGHDHGPLDPHVWLDPVRVGEIADVIADAYAELDPDAAETVEQNAADYAQTMEDLDDELQELVSTLDEDERRLITNHDALAYLALRYDFEVIATIIPGTSTDVDTTAEGFTELVETIEETGVPAIFAETTSSDRLAQALAEEVGDVEVVELFTGSLGEPGSGGETVQGMIRTNVERMVEALG